jgi:hypothetical protein
MSSQGAKGRQQPLVERVGELERSLAATREALDATKDALASLETKYERLEELLHTREAALSWSESLERETGQIPLC